MVGDIRVLCFFPLKKLVLVAVVRTYDPLSTLLLFSLLFTLLLSLSPLSKCFFPKKMLVFLLVVRTYDPLSTAVSHTPGDQILSLLAGILANHPWVSHHCFHLNYHHRHHKKSLKAYRNRYMVQLNQNQNLSFIIA